jgi:hypothetical protein
MLEIGRRTVAPSEWPITAEAEAALRDEGMAGDRATVEAPGGAWSPDVLRVD